MALGSKAWFALMRRNGLYIRRYWLSTILDLVLPMVFLLLFVVLRSLIPDSFVTGDLVPEEIPSQAFTPLRFMDYMIALKAKRRCVSSQSLLDLLTGFGVDFTDEDAANIPDDITLDDIPTFYFNLTGQQLDEETIQSLNQLKAFGEELELGGYDISGYNNDEWSVPLLKCNPEHCTTLNEDATDFCERHIVGVSGGQTAKDFIAWVHEEYPDSQTFGTFVEFDDVKAMDKYVEGRAYGRTKPKLAMGIVFESSPGDDIWNYQLRPNSTNVNFPSTGQPAAPTTPDTGRLTNDYARSDDLTCDLQGADGSYKSNSCTYQYSYNGVLTFQRLVHDFIANVTGASETLPVGGIDFAPFPSREYIGKGFFYYISPYLTITLSLGLLYPVASMISYMVKEKEYRQKELLKMMSVTESDIGWSWFVTFFLFHLITATLCGIFSTRLFTNSSFLLLWLFWLYTMIGTIVFCMVISSFTSKSTRAVLIGILVYFSGAFLTMAQPYDTGSKSAVQAISLHPIAAFSYGIRQIGDLEGNSGGLTAGTVSLSDNRNGYSFRDTLAILLVDSIVWGFLAWYLNRVIPPDYGQALPVWFPFLPSYWCGTTHKPSKATEEMAEDVEARNASIPYEPVGDLKRQAAEGKSIEIHSLRKTFGEKIAIDDLNLSIYSGQITALLGHNGAGKTTTISILTGALAATEGDATIFGKSVRSDLSSIRKDIGICLQHDCLFPDLTVKEHIQFFARLKGLYDSVSNREAEELINQAIRDVALFEKRNTRSKALSGGMKRKLSVCMAFCGGSKVVLLDEPTSGMDPFSRRFTWNVIRQYRQDRCIILTTHFMDEADILGDRIAIMSEGQLRCAGSSLFLKKTYGVGYQLTVEKQGGNTKRLDNGAIKKNNVYKGDDYEVTDYDNDSVEPEESGLETHESSNPLGDSIKETIPEATILTSVGTELKLQLPLGASAKFPSLFEMLDDLVNNKKIVSYGVSMTTLDEVFLLVAKGDSVGKSEVIQSSRRVIDENKIELQKGNLFMVHLAALFKKRASNFRRDKKAWMCTSVLPSLFVMVGFLLYRNSGRARSLPPLTLDLSSLNSGISGDYTNPIHFNGGEYTCLPGRCVQEPVSSVNSTERYSFCGGLDSSSFLSFDAKCSIEESSSIMDVLDKFEGSELISSESSTLAESSEELLETSTVYRASQYGSIWFSREPGSVISSTRAVFDDTVVANCQSNANASQYMSVRDCERLRGIGFLIQYNFTGLHTAPLFQALADQALIRYATNNPNFVIKTTIAPLPETDVEQGFGRGYDSTLTWFLLILSFPFISGAYAAFVVQEREIKAKHLQTVAGVDASAYWISTLLWDSLNYQFPLWTTVAMMFIFQVKALTTSDNDVFLGVLTLLFFYGPAAAGFSYVVSFAFKSPTFCNVVIIITGFIVSFAGSLATLIMNIFLFVAKSQGKEGGKLELASTIVNWTLRFFPPFNLAKGLLYALNVETFASLEGDPEISVFHEAILLWEVIFLAIEGVFYTAFAIFLDIYLNRPNVTGAFGRALFGGTILALSADEDTDVLAEEERVLSGNAEGDMIVIKNMSKVYGNGKIAVKNMSLGIHPGECFGLLGINGAGKTTTMGMLTAEFPPSSGDATLAGFSIVREPQRIRRKIGYCPQFDAHFSNMTGREHVELYAAVKGVPRYLINDAVRAKLADVGLSEKDSDRICSNYSGGMKRRLSLACATIGRPSVVFLDECSTGVDPVARREIWQMISDMVAVDEDGVSNTSVILTTHSMEECEALCPRIGIMANGRLRCLGSAQHLKNKFGQGYQVELKAQVIESTDSDFIQNARSLAAFKQTLLDEETAVADVTLAFNLMETIGALNTLTNDMFLSSMISEHHPQGFNVWRDASSVAGISLSALTMFCTTEFRMRNLSSFVTSEFPKNVLRERQDLKVRYEVSNEGLRISEIFSKIEAQKKKLCLSDYGVSQTSLEQVFNRHAAEAEGLKEGTNDR